MTVTEVITRARGFLSDEAALSYRWSDATLLGYVKDGLRLAFAARPDMRDNGDGTLYDTDGIASLTSGSDMPVPDDIAVAVADFVCSRALSEDDADVENLSRSKVRMETFVLALDGG